MNGVVTKTRTVKMTTTRIDYGQLSDEHKKYTMKLICTFQRNTATDALTGGYAAWKEA